MRRRASFRTSLLACGLCLLLNRGPGALAAEGEGRFTILQLNDVYRVEGLENGTRGGLARIRTVRRDLEKNGTPVLVLHAGDLLFPSIMGKYLNAEPMIRCLSLLDGKPDADDPHMIATFGNHEFEKSRGILYDRIKQSGFRWVTSNIDYRPAADAPLQPMSKAFYNVFENIVVNVGGVPVGIFALTLDVQKAEYIAYRYNPPDARKKLIADSIASLKRRGARVIVALTHQDMTEDKWLAREFPEVHLVVGGHEHFAQKDQVGKTWITKADSDAQTVMLIDVTVALNGDVKATPVRKTLDAGVAKDEQVEREVTASMEQLKAAYHKREGIDLGLVYGSTEHALEGEETAVRARETALGSVLADIIRETMDADIGLINGGGIRINDNIPAGSDITGYHMAGVFYYDDPLVKFQVSPDTLLEALRNSVSRVHLGDGRFLQVSGLRFKYHRRGPDDQPTYEVRPDEVWILTDRQNDKYTPLTEIKHALTIASGKFLYERGSEDGYRFAPEGKLPPRLDDPAVKVSIRKATEAKLLGLKAVGKRVTVRVEPDESKRRILEIQD